MRMESATAAKRNNPQTLRLAPKEGSQLRRMFDLLMASKGLPIEVALGNFEPPDGMRRKGSTSSLIEQLRNFYGLDIRRIEYGKWVLAGEWFGKTYRDYIADRIAEFDRRSA